MSVSSNGQQGQTPTFFPGTVRHCGNHCFSDLSADGHFIAFETDADGLVDRDTNDASDVFVRDRESGDTRRVSVASDGSQGEGACTPDGVSAEAAPAPTFGSFGASISARARFVAFSSCAANLSILDAKHTEDVFVHDLERGATELISLSSIGVPAFCVGGIACSKIRTTQAVSANGRYVVFDSAASNLVAGDTNAIRDVLIRDRKKGTTERVSVNSSGGEAQPNLGLALPLGSLSASISDNGRYVLFLSDAPNLVDGPPDDKSLDYVDVFVHDRQTGKTEQIDVDAAGNEETVPVTDIETLNGLEAAISPDGRFVAFISRWTGFVPSDSNDAYDVFVHDRKTGRIERVSVTSAGVEGDSYSMGHLAFSRDGRFLTFATTAHIDPDDREGGSCGVNAGLRDFYCGLTGDKDVYVYDRVTGSAELISRNRDGGADCDPDLYREGLCPQWTWSSSISADGRYVSFQSDSQQLVEDDLNDGVKDHFVRDRGLPVGSGTEEGGAPKDPSSDDRICIAEICVPPGAAAPTPDATEDVDKLLTARGANLYGASLAYRPQYDDLFVKIELEYMPQVVPGVSPVFYGLRFKVEDESYEVRATSLNYGTFGLFDCTDPAPVCTKVADLRGGYGTTGMRVVFSLPLEEIGLEAGGKLRDVEAFSGLGSYMTGATSVLDKLALGHH